MFPIYGLVEFTTSAKKADVSMEGTLLEYLINPVASLVGVGRLSHETYV